MIVGFMFFFSRVMTTACRWIFCWAQNNTSI